MEYIRTKDGNIIKILKEGIDEFGKYGMVNEENCIRNYDDLKQADTIEELCDVFVDTSELRGTNTGGWLYDEFDTKNKCLVYYEHDERKTIPLNEFDDLSKIYGAIFTYKGLIYATKMKGILPNGEIDWELL